MMNSDTLTIEQQYEAIEKSFEDFLEMNRNDFSDDMLNVFDWADWCDTYIVLKHNN